MTDVQIYAGTVPASETERSAAGLLVPFDEECSSNLGKFKVNTGAFSIPTDLTGIGMNVEHEREHVVGAVTGLTTTDKGIVATLASQTPTRGTRHWPTPAAASAKTSRSK